MTVSFRRWQSSSRLGSKTNTAVYSIEVPKIVISAIFLERRKFEAIYLHANKKDDSDVNRVTEVPTGYYDSFIKKTL